MESIRCLALMLTKLSLEDSLPDVYRRQLAVTAHNGLNAYLSTWHIVGLVIKLSALNQTCKITSQQDQFQFAMTIHQTQILP